METFRKLRALYVLKSAVEKEKFDGLCFTARILYDQDDITYEELLFIDSILPKYRYKPHSSYCWEPYAKIPRIEFLENEIEKLKKAAEVELQVASMEKELNDYVQIHGGTTDQIKRYIDLAYLIGVFNVSGIVGLRKELARLKEIGRHPYDILIYMKEKESKMEELTEL